jgi:hypothetical protein
MQGHKTVAKERSLPRRPAPERPSRLRAAALAFQCVAAPFRLVVWAAEAAISFAMLGAGFLLWMWWSGRITDAQAAAALGQLGDRLLNILSGAGAL